jgi:hypothetical protein
MTFFTITDIFFYIDKNVFEYLHSLAFGRSLENITNANNHNWLSMETMCHNILFCNTNVHGGYRKTSVDLILV